MSVNKKIIFVAAPNIQDNFKLQLFDEKKLKSINGFWDLKSCVGNKFIKEINPMNMIGLNKSTVIKQIKKIISESYHFFGYIEFANYINKIMAKFTSVNEKDSHTFKKQLFYLQREFENRLMVIDEVHNIRQIDGLSSKSTTINFLNLVTYSKNMKLLLLSATPMFDNPREIVWITNLLNLADNKYILHEREIFDASDNLLIKKSRNEGKLKLIRKLRGYVSFVHGENIFTFPYRIFPKMLNDEHSLLHKLTKKWKYPSHQINGDKISPNDFIKHTDLYLLDLAPEQNKYYEKIKTNIKNSTKYKKYFIDSKGLPFYLMDKLLHSLTMVYPKKGALLNVLEPDTINSLFGKLGLTRSMRFEENLSQVAKSFQYKKKTLDDFGRIFKLTHLQKYSSKLYTICNKIKHSEGVVIIYSRFIYAGAIPIALALEEMGFTRYGKPSLFKTNDTPPVNHKMQTKTATQKNFNQTGYIIISGDKGLSPNNKAAINSATDVNNINGEKIKVIIISKAGSEGLDFKYIRQIHILDPWYNLNRAEQIIGRGVRHMSHCALPFNKRNVEIYMYATLLKNKKEETADLSIYRLAEKKAKKIGVITRLLKENAVDCLLNVGQTDVGENKINKTVTQIVGNGTEIQFKLGDKPNTPICDFMDCNFKCNVDGAKLDYDESTYNHTFITLSIGQIFQRIRDLFKEKYTYTKKELILAINIYKNYSEEQIMVALDTLINDKTEYLTDMHDNLGHLVNVSNYYMFNPVQFTGKHIINYERSKIKNLKNQKLSVILPEAKDTQIQIPNILNSNRSNSKGDLTTPTPDGTLVGYQYLIQSLSDDMKIINELHDITKNNKRRYIYLAGWAIQNLNKYNKIPLDILRKYALIHLVDVMSYNHKIIIANVLFNPSSVRTPFEDLLREGFDKYIYKKGNLMGMILPKYNHTTIKKHLIFLQFIGGKFVEIFNFETMTDKIKTFWKELIMHFQIEKKNITNKFKIGFMFYVRNELFYKKKHLSETGTGQKCGDGKMLKPFILKDLNQINEVVNGKEKYVFEKSKILQINDDQEFKQCKNHHEININALQLCIENELYLRYLDDTNQLNGKRVFLNIVELIISEIY